MRTFLFLILAFCFSGCAIQDQAPVIITVQGETIPDNESVWLSHEHVLVDFIGADSIDSNDWNSDTVLQFIMPLFNDLKDYGVDIYVNATPQFLGRDVRLLQKLSQLTGIQIITNTGLYGAVNNKYIPQYAYQKTKEELSQMWIEEFVNGIEGTGIKPGFIKISVDNRDTLEIIDQKIVAAAALTHLQTGLTIGSHTGKARALWPQIKILKAYGVPLDRFIWIHAQNEDDHTNYLRAAKEGVWISLDGLGWDTENHLKKLIFAKENHILDRILISHDAGWFDPQKKIQSIKPYTNIFIKLKPALMSNGFTEKDWNQLISNNPIKAFSI